MKKIFLIRIVMSADLFKGLDALVRGSAAQNHPQKSKGRTKKEIKKTEELVKKNPLREIQNTEMKRSPIIKTRQPVNDASTVLLKLGAADLHAPTGMLSTNDSYNSSRLMYSRMSKPSSTNENTKEIVDKASTSQNGYEGADQSRSASLQYALTIDDVATKMANDISRSQASQVLRAKIEMSTSNLDEIWHEPSQFSISQPLAHASTASFTTAKAKIPAGKPIIESTNL